MAQREHKPTSGFSEKSTGGVVNFLRSFFSPKKPEWEERFALEKTKVHEAEEKKKADDAKKANDAQRDKDLLGAKAYYNYKNFRHQLREFEIQHLTWLTTRWKVHQLAVKELSEWVTDFNGFVNALNASYRDLAREAAMLDPPVTDQSDLMRMFAEGFPDLPFLADPRLPNFLAVADEYVLGKALKSQLPVGPIKPRPLEPSVVMENWLKANPRPPEPDLYAIPLHEHYNMWIWGIGKGWGLVNGEYQPIDPNVDRSRIPPKPANWTPDRTPDKTFIGERAWSEPLPDVGDYEALKRAVQQEESRKN